MNKSQDDDGRPTWIWLAVSRSPVASLWNLEGIPLRLVAASAWKATLEDRLLGRAAELAFYFLFALFPTLFSASSILGLAARSASQFYDKILLYLALVVPTSALGTILNTFNETTAAATKGKITFGLIAAIWSASVGVSAIQDSMNSVYKVKETRSYIMARIYAIGLTVVLAAIFTLILSVMLSGDLLATLAERQIHQPILIWMSVIVSRSCGWVVATALLALAFAVVYYWAPNVERRRWRWFTPGGGIGMLGWLIGSLGLRIYLNYFDSYSVTYGSLGAVIILLTWFYLSGLMLLAGAEINSEIEAAAIKARLARGAVNP